MNCIAIAAASSLTRSPAPSDANRKGEPDISKAAKKVDQARNPESDKSMAAVKDNDNVKLAAKAKEALVKDPALKDAAMDVNASDGVVELFGTVHDTARRVKAERVASNVQGSRVSRVTWR